MGTPVDIEMLLTQAGWLKKLARGMVRDESAADDLAQETWVRAIESPPSRQTSLRGWLAVVARNLTRQRFRSERALARRELAAARPDRLPDVARTAARVEVQRRVAEAVLALDEPHRTVVLLRYFEDMSAAEIARRLGVPASTVRSRLSRGLDRLRTDLDNLCEGDRRAWLVPLLGFLRPSRPAAGGGAGLLVGTGMVAIMAKLGVLLAVLSAAVVVVLVWRSEPGEKPPLPENTAVAKGTEGALRDEPEEEPSELRTPGPADVSGSVRDTLGEPIPGARIRVVEMMGRDQAPRVISEVSASSSGEFVIGPVSGPTVIEAGAPGYATALRSAFPGAGLDFALDAAVPLEGLVIASQGLLPVAGVSVILRHAPRGASAGMPFGTFEASTDEEGRFCFATLPPGQYGVVVYPPNAAVLVKSIVLPRSGLTDLRLVLPPTGTLVGTVTDAETGRPIAGAEIRWCADDLTVRGVSAASDADGRYLLRGIPVRSPLDWDRVIELVVRAKGYRLGVMRVEVPCDSANTQADPALQPGGSIRGKVLDSAGLPVVGAMVRVAEEIGWAETRTGNDGKFLLEDLEPGRLRVEVRAEGMKDQDAEVEVAVGETSEETLLRLEPGSPKSRIEVHVSGEDGEPIAGARVIVQPMVREPRGAPPSGTTDRTGVLVTRGSGCPSCRVMVGAPGYLPDARDDIVPGSAGPLQFVLKLGDMIRGRLVDAAGHPVPGQGVTARQKLDPAVASVRRRFGGLRVSTDENGAFELGALYPGQASVSAGLGTLRASLPDVSTRSEALELVLPGGVVTGRVVEDATGRPFPSCWVRLRGGKLSLTQLVAGESGAFTFENIPDGDYAMEASWVEGYCSRPVRIRVVGGRPEEMPVVRLVRGATVNLVLRDPLHAPRNAVVYGQAVAGGGPEKRHWFAGEDGRISTGPLVPGSYRFWIENHEHDSVKEVEVGSGEAVEVVLRENPPGCLAVAVSTVAGQPLAGAEIILRGPDGKKVHLDGTRVRRRFKDRKLRDPDLIWEQFERTLRTTKDGGRMLFPGLSPGRYEVTIRAEGHQDGAGVAEVSDEGATVLRLSLSPRGS